MAEILPHQQRVLDEKADLAAKIAKLGVFLDGPLFAGLGKMEQRLLRQQFSAMQVYHLILEQRIALWGDLLDKPGLEA